VYVFIAWQLEINALERARIVSKKQRNLLRLRRIHLLEEGGGDGRIMPQDLLQRNIPFPY